MNNGHQATCSLYTLILLYAYTTFILVFLPPGFKNAFCSEGKGEKRNELKDRGGMGPAEGADKSFAGEGDFEGR